MKVSEFRRAVETEFGAGFGRVLLQDTVIVALGNRTPDDALAAGISAGQVWTELCRAQEVPQNRWHGAGRLEPKG